MWMKFCLHVSTPIYTCLLCFKNRRIVYEGK
nr:MAG TPA: hypothetical protein [Caudoviricetes sp.]